jgi:hypothetical protein
VLLPCRAVYDIFEADPWPSARERRAMVGSVTYRSYHATVSSIPRLRHPLHFSVESAIVIVLNFE